MKKILIGLGVVIVLFVIAFICIVKFADTSGAALIQDAVKQVDAQDTGEKGKNIMKDSYNYIDNHLDFFPVKDLQTISPEIDKKFDPRDMDKNIDSESGKLFKDSGVVYDIYEATWDGYDNNKKVTYIYVKDDDGYNYQLFYLGTVDILKGDVIDFVALPLMESEYSNVSGGTTRVFRCLASYAKTQTVSIK